jgi:hypothetical protein
MGREPAKTKQHVGYDDVGTSGGILKTASGDADPGQRSNDARR